MDAFGRIVDLISRVLGLVGAFAIILMMVHVNADIIGKFVFNHPVEGTLEIVSQYYMVAVVFLPLALVERRNGHISVELLSQHMPPRLLCITLAFGCILSIAFFTGLAYETWVVAMKKYAIGEYIRGQINVVNWPSRFLLPIGAGAFVLVALWKLWRLLKGDVSVYDKPNHLQ